MIELVLSFFVATALATEASRGTESDAARAAVVLPLVFIVMRLAHSALVAWLGRRLARTAPGTNARLRLGVFGMAMANLAAYATMLHFGWAAVVETLPLAGASMVVAQIALLLPWLLLQISWLWSKCDVHRLTRARDWPRAEFLLFHLRLLVVPASPVLAQAALDDLLRQVPGAAAAAITVPSLSVAVALAVMLLVFALSPFIFRAAIATDSLPDGPLRRRFEELAERARFRYLDIRVCRTRGNIVNAAFIGVVGRIRYVLMTDAILTTLSEDDLVGVFAHEMGHSKRRHLVYNLCLLCIFIILGHVVSQRVLPASEIVQPLFGLLGFAIYFFWVFSPIAKRFETEADVYAGEIVGDPGPIVRSLTALGWQFPDKMKRGGFIHPSLSDRVDYLARHFSDRTTAAEFGAEIARTKLSIVAFFVMSLVLWMTILPSEVVTGRWRADCSAVALAEDGATAAAFLAELDRSWPAFLEDESFDLRMSLWQTVILASQDNGKYDEAARYLGLVRQHRADFRSPALRYNAVNIACYQAAATGDWVTLDAELPHALRLLDELGESVSADDPEMLEERRDNEILKRTIRLLNHAGVLVSAELPFTTETPLSDPLATAVANLTDLFEKGPISAAEANRVIAGVGAGKRWKKDFLEALARALSTP